RAARRLAGANAAGARRLPGGAVLLDAPVRREPAVPGYVDAWDEVVLDGDPSARKFLAFYLRNDQVWAVAGMGRGLETARLHGLLLEEGLPVLESVRSYLLSR
uniref:oxidoreductase C-terminal domain-containing protein n=1 Tax=Rhodothermus marinus TaxID=29549 RepID=UPI0023428ABE